MIDNKYKRIYDQLIGKRRRDVLDKKDCYCESHHILPKSLGGSDKADNLVNLTPREHYIAHRLLPKFTEGNDHYKMQWALHRTVYGRTEVLTSRQYESFRIMWSNFLKENHPSKTSSVWTENLSKAVYRQWEDAVERRKETSDRMKALIVKRKATDYDAYMKEQKERSARGSQKSKEKTALRLEYNGVTYLGFNDLREATGISKNLYRKFYANGIDPTFRVGRDGPMKNEDLVDTVERYCYNVNEELPVDKTTALPIVKRMISIGLFSTSEADRYMKYIDAKALGQSPNKEGRL